MLGATGSIGRQCLQVISSHPDRFEAKVLTAKNSTDSLIELAIKHRPEKVVITDSSHYKLLKEALAPYPIQVFAGDESLCDVVGLDNVDIVFNALVGFSGLAPTLAAIKARKPVALANKETLVAGGGLVMGAVQQSKTPIIPVDSEHSAIFQCLQAEHGTVEKLILTASGGPFFHTPVEMFASIRKEQALKHPNWSMGEKVTIDSATMMNKGLEVIEAHWLFGVPASQIDVLVHPQSIIHSMVQFEDGSIKAQLSHPDMRIPIQFALSFPQRLPLNAHRVHFEQLKSLDFYGPDKQKFPCLSLAYSALEMGGNIPCALNAANEVAVDAFLRDRISFHHIPALIQKTLQATPPIPQPALADIMDTNILARNLAQNLLTTF